MAMNAVSNFTERARWVRFWFSVGWIGILVSACDQSPDPAAQLSGADRSGEGAARATEAPTAQAGPAKMVELLAEIAQRRSEGDDEFFGHRTLRTLETELNEMAADSPIARRLQVNYLLGWHYRRLGEVETAIDHYQVAYRLLKRLRDRIPPEQASQAVFEVGVTYMRLGEVQNCAAMRNADRCLLPIQGGGVHEHPEGSRNAARYFTEVLEDPAAERWLKLKARWLLNIAYMTLDEYPEGVPDEYLIPPEVFDSDEDFPRFTEIAITLGLDAMTPAGGSIAEDFDNDGFLDLVVSSSGPAVQLRYYHNDGDGTFSDRTHEAGLEGLVGGLNLEHADYDNDGDADVFVMRGAWLGEEGRVPNSLIRNNGDGTFTDVTFEAGLGDAHYPTQTAGWADYDNDGDLDLYIGNEFRGELEMPCQLFRNNGDGTFTDVAKQARVENNRFAKSVAWGDYDADGFPDLYVSNMGDANRLYHNNRDGSFRDVAVKSGVVSPLASFSAWFWDFDNDGALDLYVSTYALDDVSAVAGSYLGMEERGELARLYRGDGRGGFEDVAAEQNLHRFIVVMGANFGDLDNDGFLDFYLGTGYPHYEALMPNVMYRNRGGSGFSDVTTNGGFGHLQKGHGIAFADFDNDGDQDVFEEMGGAVPGDAFANALFENPGFGNHWIKIRLVGVRSNRAGIGARIRIEITEDGAQRSIFRQVNTGGSFGSNPLRQEIGVGGASKIDVIEIFWPTSGETQRFLDVDVDQMLEITEGQQHFRRLPLKSISFRS